MPPRDAQLAALLAELASQPHDALIKRVLSTHLNATRELLQSRLTPALAASIDWSSLALEPASFVKRDLKQTHSDLLFSVRRNRRRVFIYFLVEHQSTLNLSMPLRLLGYMVEIWTRHREQHPSESLPPVIPLVLNQGPSEWTVSTQFADLFRDSMEDASGDLDDLLRYLPKFEHCLWDLSNTDPRSETQDTTLKSTLYLMQQARRAKSLEGYFQWLDTHYAMTIDLDLFRLFLLYALHLENALDVQKLMQQTLTHQNLRTTAMTAAALLKAEGKVEGKAEGEARGRLLGGITALEQVLNLPATPSQVLESMTLLELELAFEKLRTQSRDRVSEAR